MVRREGAAQEPGQRDGDLDGGKEAGGLQNHVQQLLGFFIPFFRFETQLGAQAPSSSRI